MKVKRRSGWAYTAGALLGFLLVTARLNPLPGDVAVGVPEQRRLATLIRVEQRRSASLRQDADSLRRRVQGFEQSRDQGDPERAPGLARARAWLGLVAAEGPGLVVTLDDSKSRESPSGNLNDLVIHSQDVQAVANGLWAAGAEVLAVNGQRVVPTSALLCVGNTLLINGTVHSPPFRFSAIGRDLREPFLEDPLVERFEGDATRFGLGFRVEAADQVTVPAYRGAAAVRYARPG